MPNGQHLVVCVSWIGDAPAPASPATGWNLRNLTGTSGEVVITEGFWSAGDGGGGLFYWDDTSLADDGGLSINPASGTGPGWRRIFTGAIHSRWFGAKGDGLQADDMYLARWLRAGLRDPNLDPAKHTRGPRYELHLDCGEYRITEPFKIHSVDGLVIRGDGPASYFSLDAAEEVPCVVDFNGVAECVFSDLGFSIKPGAAATYGVLIRWRPTDIPGEPSGGAARTTTLCYFVRCGVGGRFREAGWQIGSPGNSLQEDQIHFRDCTVQGGNKGGYPGEIDSVYWQRGFRFGSGVNANNLAHTAHNLQISHVRYGLEVWSTDLVVTSALIQNCESDLYLRVRTYFEIAGVRSEGSACFITAPGQGNWPSNVIVRNCQFEAPAQRELTKDGTGRFIHWEDPGMLTIDGLAVSGNDSLTYEPRFYAAVPSDPATLTVRVRNLLVVGATPAQCFETASPARVVFDVERYTKAENGAVKTTWPGRMVFRDPSNAAADFAIGAPGGEPDASFRRVAAGTIAAPKLRFDGATQTRGYLQFHSDNADPLLTVQRADGTLLDLLRVDSGGIAYMTAAGWFIGTPGNTRIRIDAKGIGFQGAVPIATPAIGPKATNLSSAITLLNQIRAALIGYGLIRG